MLPIACAMHRRTLLAAVGASLASPALSQPAQVRTLRFVPQADVTALDPLSTTSYAVRNHGHLCWDTLYGLDAGFRPQPQLAEGCVVQRDGLEWVFTLRAGPRFHDGEPVLARDAVASIRRWMVRDTHGQTLAGRMAGSPMAGMRVLDDRRFAIDLVRPFGAMLDALGKSSSYPCFIMPERFAGTPATVPLKEVVGSGPYRFLADEWRPGFQAVYGRFEGYVPSPVGVPSVTAGPKLAWFERVEWRVIPDPATAAAALQAGEVDWWERLNPDLRPLMLRTAGVVVDRVETNGTMAMLRPNHMTEPFSDPAVRRAVLGAIRQEDFMGAINSDPARWRRMTGPFTPGSPLAAGVGDGIGDLGAGVAAVRAAGKAGARTVVLNPGDQPTNSALTLVAEDLFGKLGFGVEDATSDFGTMLARRAKKEPLDRGGWSALIVLFGGEDLNNPGGHPLLRANGGEAWFGWPTDPVLEGLRDRWFDAPDDAARREIGVGINAQFGQSVPYWPLGQYFVDTAYRRGLVDIRRGMSLPLNVRRE